MFQERKNKLRALARLMNKQNEIPIPVTKLLLDCFDLVITPEETGFLLRMSTESHTYDQAASLTNMPEEQFSKFFETLLKKGVIWLRHNESGEERFILAPIMVGWIETQLCNGEETPEKREFAQRFDRFIQSLKKLNAFPLRNFLNLLVRFKLKPFFSIAAINPSEKIRAKVQIDVNRTLQLPESKIYLTKSVNELIEQKGESNSIALLHCFCRQWRKMINEPCRFNFPSESCMVIGDLAKHMVQYGFGRYISKEEALKTLKDAQKAGAVHIVIHERDDIKLPQIAICNCCWDCCAMLGSYNRGIAPLQFKCYYTAQILDDSLCIGCGRCERYCPVNAISVLEQKATIDIRKCIGCGQCASQCLEEIITFKFNERNVTLPLQKKTKARIREDRHF